MCLVLVFAVFTSFALKASHAPFGCPRPGYWIMTVTGDHCCRCTWASGATFPMALHSMACWATLGSSVGSLQQQSVVSDPVKCGALRNQKRSLGQKQSSETSHAPVGSSSFFQGDDFSHFTCTVWFIEKGRRSWFVELLRALAPPCLEAHAPYLQAPRPASLSSWQLFCWMGLFSPFVISWSCGIFNRLHHFGVMLYWDGQLRCINYPAEDDGGIPGGGGGYWITETCFLCRNKWLCGGCSGSFCPSPEPLQSKASQSGEVVGIRWSLRSFILLFQKLITLAEWLPSLLPFLSVYDLRWSEETL